MGVGWINLWLVFDVPLFLWCDLWLKLFTLLSPALCALIYALIITIILLLFVYRCFSSILTDIQPLLLLWQTDVTFVTTIPIGWSIYLQCWYKKPLPQRIITFYVCENAPANQQFTEFFLVFGLCALPSVNIDITGRLSSYLTLLTMSSWTCLLVEHAAKPRGKQILPWPIKALQVFARNTKWSAPSFVSSLGLFPMNELWLAKMWDWVEGETLEICRGQYHQ